VGTTKSPAQPGSARSPGISVQAIIERDGDRPSGSLTEESYRFLGDEDIPFARYTSRAFYEKEMERMWPRVWQWACREEHIPEIGDYYVYDIGPYSILIVRTAQGIRGYVNSCLHRGTKLRPSASEGHTKELRCPFHGWTWNLAGELIRQPSAWDFPHVDPAKFHLPQVRVRLWGGFVFINMDSTAPTLEEYLEVLPEHAKRSGLEHRQVAIHVEKELNCNWKVASEAFVEAYHVQETHPQIMVSNGDESSQYDVFGPHVNRIISPNGVTSPHLGTSVTEQERADAMLAGDTKDAAPVVAEGSTARSTMAEYLRQILSIPGAGEASTTELIDTHGYLVFPTGHFFLGQTFPIAYRIRPLDDGPDRALFELLVLRSTSKDDNTPAVPIRLKVEESYSTIPGISQSFAAIMDQDTSITGWQQEGFKSSRKGTATLASYQEVRIRHAHQTLDAYLATPPGEPVEFDP
jgi:phenylpropionate dioxygenase-like ring-hydroxylating dioxygenase large terminal subunit